MKRALTLAALGALFALASRSARAADLIMTTMVPGADAGSLAFTSGSWLPGNQFMVSCPTYSGVTYRLCPAADAGIAQCVATSTDAPIQADKQIDLCAPNGYTGLSLYKMYDGGNPTCSIFKVTPKTVCQTP
jgi:hypothetical protein